MLIRCGGFLAQLPLWGVFQSQITPLILSALIVHGPVAGLARRMGTSRLWQVMELENKELEHQASLLMSHRMRDQGLLWDPPEPPGTDL